MKKLTAVTITYQGEKHVFFLELEHKPAGGAILPNATLQDLLDKVGVTNNNCYSVA